jgi:hypothetical protein
MAMWRAKGTDPRKLWILEEVGCRLQEGVPPCESGIVKKEPHQTNLDHGKLWTAEGVDRSQNEDNPQCKNGMV